MVTTDTTSIVRARDVMRKGIISIDGMATAREAAAKMRSEKVYSLLVKKRHVDDVWGILGVHDLIKGVMVSGRSPEEVHVYELMTKPVITVPAEMDIRYVARMLIHAGLRRAPVENGGELMGMVSLSALILDNDFF